MNRKFHYLVNNSICVVKQKWGRYQLYKYNNGSFLHKKTTFKFVFCHGMSSKIKTKEARFN